MRRVTALAVLAGLACVLSACRESPPLPTRPEGDLVSYVGIAMLGGGLANVLVVFTQSEDQDWSGSITYRSQTLAFSELDVDTLSDTVWFAYSRDNILHRAWALERSSGMEVHFTQPGGIPVFNVYRESNGRNMTGLWVGEMSSTVLQGQRAAELLMEQEGNYFEGQAEINLWEFWEISLEHGEVSGLQFELSGMIHGSDTYPTFWEGSYVGYDSIAGTWIAGESAAIDAGEFLFIRSFR